MEQKNADISFYDFLIQSQVNPENARYILDNLKDFHAFFLEKEKYDPEALKLISGIIEKIKKGERDGAFVFTYKKDHETSLYYDCFSIIKKLNKEKISDLLLYLKNNF